MSKTNVLIAIGLVTILIGLSSVYFQGKSGGFFSQVSPNGDLRVEFPQDAHRLGLFSSLGYGFDTEKFGVKTTQDMCFAAASYYSQYCTITSSCTVSGDKYVISGTGCPSGGFGPVGISHFSAGNYLVCTDNGGIYTGTGTKGGDCSIPIPQGCEIRPVLACEIETGKERLFSSTCLPTGYTTNLDVCTAASPPVPSPPNPVIDFFSAIGDFVRSILAFFGITFSIFGVPDTNTLGDSITAQVILNTPSPPDSDYSDGTVTRYYASAFVADSAGTILTQTPQEEVLTTFVRTVSYTPTKKGDYVVGGVMVKAQNTYDFTTNTWGTWTQATVDTDSKVFKVTSPTAPAPPEPTFDIKTAIQGFISSIKSVLCSTLGIFCGG